MLHLTAATIDREVYVMYVPHSKEHTRNSKCNGEKSTTEDSEVWPCLLFVCLFVCLNLRFHVSPTLPARFACLSPFNFHSFSTFLFLVFFPLHFPRISTSLVVDLCALRNFSLIICTYTQYALRGFELRATSFLPLSSLGFFLTINVRMSPVVVCMHLCVCMYVFVRCVVALAVFSVVFLFCYVSFI